MVSGFVIRCWLRFLPLYLSVLLFAGCGMMSVLVDEDAGEDTADTGDAGEAGNAGNAGNAGTAGTAGSAGSSSDASAADEIPAGCGDGIIDGRLREACDTNNVGGATCRSIGQGTGELRCNDYCQFDLSLCTGAGGFGDGGIGDGGFPLPRDGGPII